MRNFLKLCLVGTIVAGSVMLSAQDAFAATKKKKKNDTTTSVINAAAPAVGRVGSSLIQGNTSGAGKAATSGVTNVVKKGVSALTGSKALGKSAGQLTKATTNKLTGGSAASATTRTGAGASGTTTRAGAGVTAKGGAGASGTTTRAGAGVTAKGGGASGSSGAATAATTKTYNIAEVSSAAGTGQTGVVTDSTTGLRTIATQNGTFQETSAGVFTKVDGSTRIFNDGQLTAKLAPQFDDITVKDGLIDSVLDPQTNSITDSFGNEFTRVDGGWVQTKVGTKGMSAGASGGVGAGSKAAANAGSNAGANAASGGLAEGVDASVSLPGEPTQFTLSNGKVVTPEVGDMVYKDGTFTTIKGIGTDGSLTLSDGTTASVGKVNLDTFSGKGLDGADVSYAQTDAKTVVGSDGSKYELNPETKQWEQKAEGKVDEAKAKAAEAKAAVDTGNETNAIQYAILILQAIEGMHQEDATREVTVEGAQKLQDSQGSPQDSEITPDTSLDGSNLSCASNSLAYLLRENPVDITLMDVSDLDPTTTAGEIAIKNRRNQLLQEYAVSAAIISAGSNAISSQFYMRVAQLAATASSTTGTLGSMSVLNDSERYPYFEMVRQVALSGVQLGLKGASTLSHVIVGSVLPKADEGNGDSGGDSGNNENPGNGNSGNE